MHSSNGKKHVEKQRKGGGGSSNRFHPTSLTLLCQPTAMMSIKILSSKRVIVEDLQEIFIRELGDILYLILDFKLIAQERDPKFMYHMPVTRKRTPNLMLSAPGKPKLMTITLKNNRP